MTSVIRANFWQNSSGVVRGSVINVYHSRYPSTNTLFSTTAWTDLNVITLTPESLSSRFILMPSYHISGRGGFKITRNGVDVTAGNPNDGTGTYQQWQSTGQTEWNSSSERQFVSFQYVDSPSTTSVLTYRVQIRPYSTDAGNRIGVNEVGTSGASGATALHSGFTIMEIAV